MKYSDYPTIKEIIATDENFVYYKSSDHKIKKFDTNKISNKKYKELVKKHINKVTIIAGDIVWAFNNDEAFFGRDTIFSLSSELTTNDLFNELAGEILEGVIMFFDRKSLKVARSLSVDDIREMVFNNEISRKIVKKAMKYLKKNHNKKIFKITKIEKDLYLFDPK